MTSIKPTAILNHYLYDNTSNNIYYSEDRHEERTDLVYLGSSNNKIIPMAVDMLIRKSEIKDISGFTITAYIS